VTLFILGISLNILISVTIVILTPSIQRWWEERGKTSHAKTLHRITKEYDDALYYALEPDALMHKLLLRIMGILLYGVYLVLLVKIDVTQAVGSELHGIFTMPTFLRLHPIMLAGAIDAFQILFMIFVCVATIFVVTLWQQSFSLVHHVQFIETYIESVPDEVRNRKREALAIAMAYDRMTPSSYALAKYNELIAAIESATPPDDAAEAKNTTAQIPSDPSAPLT
jgi:hypothetical protein